MHKGRLLTGLIFAGLITGAVVGQLLYDPNYVPGDRESVHAHRVVLEVFQFFGSKIFMSLLKMLIIPLVAASIIYGVTSIGDFSSLGKIGLTTLVYYFSTMLVAVTIGLVLVQLIKPGCRTVGQEQKLQAERQFEQRGGRVTQAADQAPQSLAGEMLHLVQQMIPTNIIRACAEGRPLPVITFSLFFGIILTTMGPQARVIIEFFHGLYEVIMRMVGVILWIAPPAVFCLLAWTVARMGLATFVSVMGKYMGTVLLGLAIHGFVVLPLVLLLFGRAHPFKFMGQMKRALLTAFATDSSSATLPVTMQCAEQQGGVSRKASGFVLPLGSTINMDGTALYEAVAVIFLAQVFGVQLAASQWVLVALTATFAAVGAAGIPEAGLVTMIIVITTVNQGAVAGRIPEFAVFLILGVDRILDMCRTTVNVWGDAVGAKIITRIDG